MSSVVLKTIAQGTVTTSGTEVRVSSTDIQYVVRVIITAPNTNTGYIYIGDSSVATTRGIEILKGTSFVIDAPNGNYIDLKNMWVDAATNGDKFNVSYLQRVVG